jgi:L-asparaginase
MAIRIIVTGGTIDDRHLKPKPGPRPETYIPRMLKEARIVIPVQVESICQKDSREISEAERKKILDACEHSTEKSIIVTHGTITIAETARYLGPKLKNKTVVLTGAVIPFAEPNSDSMFNLGSAIMAAQLLGNGVYVVMNGKVFTWSNVKEDVASETFVELIK